jgi:hypothetical protein
MRKLAILLLILVACESGKYARFKAEKSNPNFHGSAGKNTLVLVASPDPAGRENLEDQFAIEGVKRNIEITPSHRLIPNFKDVTKEAVQGLVKSNNFDRVIVIRTVAGSAKAGQHSYYEDYYSVVGTGYMYPSMYDMWGSTYSVVFSPTDPPPSMTSFMDFTLETVFYDGSNAEQIWSGLTEITTSRYKGDAAKSYVATILSRLQGKDLL